MQPDLFWRVWGLVSLWRRRHAALVRRNEALAGIRSASALPLLRQVVSAWEAEEGVRLRRRVAMHSPWMLWLVSQRSGGTISRAFWLSRIAPTVMVFAHGDALVADWQRTAWEEDDL